jgi:hypothetical protein
MKTHREEEFLEWAAGHGIGLDERHPDSAVLTFKPDPGLNRFWVVPPQPERRPYFLALMLDLAGDWRSCWVWRHMGSWPERPDPDRPNNRVEFQILKGIGMPMGTGDIAEFERAERDQLITLLFSTTIFGWSVGEDLYVVPNHTQYIIKASHHNVVHLSFRNLNDLQQFINGMEEEEFWLPKVVPDPTFKIPEWMKDE